MGVRAANTDWICLFLFVYFVFLSDKYPKSFQNPFFYLWVMASIVSSFYAYTWDIKMDWGLFDSKPGDNKFLREEIVYSSTVIIEKILSNE